MPKTLIQPQLKPFSPRPAFSDIYPLDEFYAARKLTLPVIGRIEDTEVPEPYHSLLVHESDMTSTLEKFHRGKIHIEIIARHTTDNEYFREVVLKLNDSAKPV